MWDTSPWGLGGVRGQITCLIQFMILPVLKVLKCVFVSQLLQYSMITSTH